MVLDEITWSTSTFAATMVKSGFQPLLVQSRQVLWRYGDKLISASLLLLILKGYLTAESFMNLGYDGCIAFRL